MPSRTSPPAPLLRSRISCAIRVSARPMSGASKTSRDSSAAAEATLPGRRELRRAPLSDVAATAPAGARPYLSGGPAGNPSDCGIGADIRLLTSFPASLDGSLKESLLWRTLPGPPGGAGEQRACRAEGTLHRLVGRSG